MNVHKAGSKNDPSNYRPISVLPVFSKILERGVHKMVYDHLQLNNLLSPSQSDFRPLHSTSTYLTHVTNTLLQNIEKGLLTGLVFLDLSKAFDTLNHNLLLDKLVQSFCLSTSARQQFFSYLTNRSQSVCVNGIVSEPQKIDFGAPPGQRLLFIMYINDISHIIRYSNVENMLIIRFFTLLVTMLTSLSPICHLIQIVLLSGLVLIT